MTSVAPVVSNAGPLMVLAKLNLLHLLKELYGRVRIPRSVYEEVVIEGLRQGYEDARTLKLFLDQMNWMPEEVTATPRELQTVHLDRGECDTLALAIPLGKGLVLMDETAGREVARFLGVTVRGSLGVLVEAYRKRLISADQLRLYCAELDRRNDVWINRTLAERLLREVLGADIG